ncbi:MAG: 50S ribosomal protein L35 [Oscillospiraceae bacterium]|jgi:large subunit ribosomal protein L35|nr:50S ribosomal protein L35 [Oscillospiraceae bacterium]
MPKIKTHSGAKKRFKISGKGKFIRSKANKSHILDKKTRKRKRNLRHTAVTDRTNFSVIRHMLPYR